MRLLNDCDLNYRTATSKRLLVELTLIRLCQLLKPATPPFDSLDRTPPLGDPAVRNPASPSATVAAVSAPPQTPQPAAQHAPEAPAPPQQLREPAQQYAPQTYAQPQPPAPAAPRPRPLNRPSSFRLTDTSPQAKAAATTLQPRTTPVTPEGFLQAWGQFIANNPSLHILVNAMRSATPQPAGDNAYRIVVDHPAQQQAFELSMTKLVEYLRNSLSNDLLTLKVDINTTPVGARQLPPREFLKKVVEANPSMAQFLHDINAEMV